MCANLIHDVLPTFTQAKSKPSLVAGLGIGGLFLLSGVIIQKGSDKEGHLLALATSALLVGGEGFSSYGRESFRVFSLSSVWYPCSA